MSQQANTLPVIRSAHLLPFIEVLTEMGESVDGPLAQAHLPHFCGEASGYVPVTSLRTFVGRAAVREGCDAIGWTAGAHAGTKMLSNSTATHIDRSPTLYEALRSFCADLRAEASGSQAGLAEHGDHVYFWHLGSTLPGIAGYHQMQAYAIAVWTGVVRRFLGQQWQPEAIWIEAQTVPTSIANDLYPDSRVLTGQPFGAIQIPRALMHHASGFRHSGIRTAAGCQAKADPTSTVAAEASFVEALRLVLDSYLVDGRPSVEAAAALAGTSVRTLQRRLSTHKLSYSQLLEQVTLDRATRMLAETNASILEVSLEVGYNDPSNFSRAFRRLTGVSPQEYRELRPEILKSA